MKRAIVTIAFIALLFAGCSAGCARMPELASAAADMLPVPVTERLAPIYHKAEQLMFDLGIWDGTGAGADGAAGSEADGTDDATANGQANATGSGKWSLPSLEDIGLTAGRLTSAEDVALVPVDDYGQNYVFEYAGTQFSAYFDSQSWKVYDSYRITNHNDIVIICQALLNEHIVYGRDFATPRTADDMAYEWEQHNLVYKMLPEGNHWRNDAKDVDLDPYDQGLSYEEMYERRTGEKFDVRRYLPGTR